MSEKIYSVKEHLKDGSEPVGVIFTHKNYARDDAIKAIMNLLGIFDGTEATLLIDGKPYLEVRK